MNSALALWVALYFVAIAALVVGMLRLKRSRRAPDTACVSVSVIVSARNEEQDLPACLASLAALDYPRSLLQIILVDDRSTDATGALIDAYAQTHPGVVALHTERLPDNGLEAKARGIAHGFAAATGHWVLITDADAQVTPGWIRHLLADVDDSVGLVGGSVIVEGRGPVGLVERASWAFVQLFSAGAAGLGMPFICVGPNMGIRRSVYIASGGLERAPFRVAEDLALTRMVTKAGLRIRTYLDEPTSATLAPVPSFAHLLSQQRRWLGGGMEQGWGMRLSLMLATGWGFGVAAFLLVGWIAWPVWWAAAVVARLVIDGIALGLQAQRMHTGLSLAQFVVVQLYTPLVFLFLPISLIIGNDVSWRGAGYAVSYRAPRSPRSPRSLLMRAMLAAGASQLAGLIVYDFGTDPAGRALEVAPLNAMMLQVPLYLSGLFAVAAAWALVRALLPVGRRVVDFAGVALFALVVLATTVDLGMQRFRGERIAWNQVTTYGTGDLLNSDWIAPLAESPTATALMVAALLLGWAALARAWWRGSSASEAGRGAALRTAVLCAVAAFGCYLPTRFAYYHQRQLARPAQAVLAEEWLARPGAWAVADEAAARAGLRVAVDGAARGGWIADSFPIWRRGLRGASPSFGAAAADPPDIVIFSIESLRGRDVGWGFGGRTGAASLTPHLDSLARDGVTFPHHISGGEPSPRGFISLQTGVWEHGQLFIVANRPDLHVDALPERLHAAGYWNAAFWGGNPSFDNQLTWARRWYDEVVFDLPENRWFYFRTTPDRVLMDRVIEHIDAHDRTRGRQPVLFYVASNGTHTPYDLEAGSPIAADVPPSPDRQRRYDLALRNVDAQIGRVVAHLRARPRWNNTVIIVVGDHADRTTEPADPRWRGMPTDALVATAALIFGPRRLIGAPRVENAPSSHVDILPTVMAWFGDTTPVATMGRDLFDTTHAAARQAVAINSRGYRLDRAGFTLMVDSRDAAIVGAWRSFTGESPAVVPLRETPFADDEPQRLRDRIAYWSHLVDQNRVRPRR